MNKQPYPIFTMVLNGEDRKRLEEMALASRRSMAQVVRDLLEDAAKKRAPQREPERVQQ